MASMYHSVSVTGDATNNRVGVQDININAKCDCGHMAFLHNSGAGACLAKELTHSASVHPAHKRRLCACVASTTYSQAGSDWA